HRRSRPKSIERETPPHPRSPATKWRGYAPEPLSSTLGSSLEGGRSGSTFRSSVRHRGLDAARVDRRGVARVEAFGSRVRFTNAVEAAQGVDGDDLTLLRERRRGKTPLVLAHPSERLGWIRHERPASLQEQLGLGRLFNDGG